MKVLFVCLGNICRSPTADAITRERIASRQLGDKLVCDSAGTGDWHVGQAPDPRAQKAGAGRGYDLSILRARQLVSGDFAEFDYILVMDNSNLANARQLQPVKSRAKLLRLLDFLSGQPEREVPDPYYGGDQGFDRVLDLLEAAIDQFLEEVVCT